MNIESEILDYVNCNENTGALLLTGPWGCGKSYLMEQIAKDLNQEKAAAIAVISLFGLDSISAINKRVKDEYISLKLGMLGKSARKLSKKLAILVKDGLAVAGSAAPGVTGLAAASQGLSSALSYDLFGFFDVQSTIGNNDSKRKFVIVFDDLERCDINSKKDILGAINNFVENKQIKVIVIADEDKIDGDDYREYKEKLISRTLCMTADYDSIIENISANYAEAADGYRDFLKENADLIKSVFAESRTSNIRMLKTILADFERVYAAWTKFGFAIEYMPWALYTFGAEVYLSKAPDKDGKPAPKRDLLFFTNEGDDQYPNIGKYHSSFITTKQWITSGTWNAALFTEELKRKYAETDMSPLDRFLTYGFWDMQQEDIDVGLPQAVSLSYAGELSKDSVITLIQKIHALNEYNIAIPVQIDYQLVEDGLEKRLLKIRNGKLEDPASHLIIKESQFDAGASHLAKSLNRFDNRIESANNREKFIQYLNDRGSTSNYSILNLNMEEFDDELFSIFCMEYRLSNNIDRKNIALALLDLSFYSSEYSTQENMQHTTENFVKLIDFLKALDDTDSIAKLINISFRTRSPRKLNCQKLADSGLRRVLFPEFCLYIE